MSLVGIGNQDVTITPWTTSNRPKYYPQPLSLAPAGATTLTAAQFVNATDAGLLITPGAALNVTTPTAAEIVAEYPSSIMRAGFSLTSHVTNLSGANVATIVGGTDVTITGTAALAVDSTSAWTVIVTDATSGSEAVTIQVSP